MNRRPLVGVSGPDRRGATAWLMTNAAIVRAGGRASRLTPSRFGSGELLAAASLDALVLGGGADIDSARYTHDESVGATLGHRVDSARDGFELALLQRVLERGIPVLGICRGAQLLNVQFGGSLYGDVADLYLDSPHVRSVLPRKRIHIERDSRLAGILDSTSCWVNALHHQAIHRLGEGLRIVARDDAGVVQAIEGSGPMFCVGVQWHPEFMPQERRQRALFAALVREACSTVERSAPDRRLP